MTEMLISIALGYFVGRLHAATVADRQARIRRAAEARRTPPAATEAPKDKPADKKPDKPVRATVPKPPATVRPGRRWEPWQLN